MSIASRIRIEDVATLCEGWGVLKRTQLSYRRSDGTWQQQTRETYDRGNGATILLYDLKRRTVVLTRQFRLPAFVNGHDGLLIEAPAGKLEGAEPGECARKEAEEETGFKVGKPKKLFEAFMSPGSVTERLFFYAAPYKPSDRKSKGGGLAHEGEDIEVFEPTIEEAMAMLARGEIADGKTIMLLQHAKLAIFPPLAP